MTIVGMIVIFILSFFVFSVGVLSGSIGYIIVGIVIFVAYCIYGIWSTFN